MAVPQLCQGGLGLLWGQLGWETARSYWEPALARQQQTNRQRLPSSARTSPQQRAGETQRGVRSTERWEVGQEPGGRNVLDVEQELR